MRSQFASQPALFSKKVFPRSLFDQKFSGPKDPSARDSEARAKDWGPSSGRDCDSVVSAFGFSLASKKRCFYHVLSIFLSIHQYIWLSGNLYIYIYTSICLPVCLSVRLSVRPSILQSIHPCIFFWTRPTCSNTTLLIGTLFRVTHKQEKIIEVPQVQVVEKIVEVPQKRATWTQWTGPALSVELAPKESFHFVLFLFVEGNTIN